MHRKLLTGVRDAHGAAFERILHFYSVPTSRVIIEMPAYPADDDKWLAGVVDSYRHYGYHVALDMGDDIDTVLRAWRTLPDFVTLPDYLKVGARVIKEALRDADVKRRLIEVVGFSHSHDARIIAIKLERSDELDFVKEIGFDYAQGNVLGLPLEKPSFAVPPQLSLIPASLLSNA